MYETTFKNIDDTLWKDAGCSSELDYIEQTSWILFLKYLDDYETDKANSALLNGEVYNSILEGWSLKDVTPTSDIVEDQEDVETLKRVRARKPVFRFSMVDIPKGSELTFIRDETVSCSVAGDREVEFDGKVTSLNQVTLNLLNTRFGKDWGSVRGPDF